MESTYYGLTGFDMVVLGASFISGLHVMMRGFMRELLSLISWIGAFLITLRFGYFFAEIVQNDVLLPAETFMPFWFVVLVSSVLMAIGSFMALSTASTFIVGTVNLARPGFIDRLLGFCFGVTRALLLFSVFYSIYALMVPVEAHPEWLLESRTRPMFEWASEVFRAFVYGIAANGGQAV